MFNHCLAPVFGEDVKSAFDSAVRISREKGHRYLDGTHMFAAWLLQQDSDPILPDYLELLHSLDSVVTNLGLLPRYLPSSIGPRVRAAIAMSSVDLHLSFSDKSVTRSDLVMINSIVRGSVLEAVILQSGKSPISVVEHILDRFKLSALHGGLILKRLGFIPGPGNSGCD